MDRRGARKQALTEAVLQMPADCCLNNEITWCFVQSNRQYMDRGL